MRRYKREVNLRGYAVRFFVAVLLAFPIVANAGTWRGDAALHMYVITKDKQPLEAYDNVKKQTVEVSDSFLAYRADDYDVHLRMYPTSSKRFSYSDYVILTFRELFSGKTYEYKQPIPWPWFPDIAHKGDINVHVTPEVLALKPGFYYVRSDLYQGDKNVTQKKPGSAFFYLAAPGESTQYLCASYAMGYLSFLVDPETNSVLQTYPAPFAIPPIMDPFDPDTRETWLVAHQCGVGDLANRHFTRDLKGIGELVGDCGIGLVFAWKTYQLTGDQERSDYAHKLFDRVIRRRLLQDELVFGSSYSYAQMYFHAARPLIYACIMFHDDPVYGNWAKQSFGDLAVWMSEHSPAIRLSHRCSATEDGVYTGRIFSSKAFFEIARQFYPEAPFADPIDNIDRIIEYAVEEANYIHEHGGHYQHPEEPAYIKKCGNINMAGGMVAALHFARSQGRTDEAEIIANCLHELFAAINPKEMTRPSGWMVCDARTICTMALRLLGYDSVIGDYRDDCVVSTDYTPGHQQRYNEVGAWMLTSTEYEKAVAEGRDWQLLVTPK